MRHAKRLLKLTVGVPIVAVICLLMFVRYELPSVVREIWDSAA